MKNLVDKIKAGAIGVLPTDTIYGIHGLALDREVVEKIYRIRERNPKKPFIILISSVEQLKLFKIRLDGKIKAFLNRIWPNPVSVILPCPDREFAYLHRGTKTLAFRLPKKTDLSKLINKTGPLISTSVNPQGLKPASTIKQAKEYFGDRLNFYIDAGKLESPPSTLIKIENDKIQILRQGKIKVACNLKQY